MVQKTRLVTLLALTTPFTAHAAVLDVCTTCTHTTVQSAIDAAVDGVDEISVAPGVYPAFVVDKSLDIYSTGGSAVTTITGGNEVEIRETAGHTAVTVSIDGFTVALAKRAFKVKDASIVDLFDIVASGYASDDDGHGIRVEGGSSVVVTTSTFTTNAAKNEGGHFTVKGASSLTVDSCTVSLGTAAKGGGAIVKEDSELIIIGGTWSTHTASGTHGGTIYMSGAGSSIDISGGASLVDGWAEDDGGQIYDLDGGTITVNDAHFEGGIADNGGSIWSDGGTVSLTDADFVDGFAVDDGGHLTQLDGSLTMVGGKLEQGDADFGGGAFVDGAVPFVMDGVEVLDCNADSSGGGVYVDNTTIAFDGVQFVLNTADGAAGVYLGEGAGGTVDAGLFDRNDATATAGGLWHGSDEPLTVSDTRFEGNDAANGAGMVSAGVATPGAVTVQRGEFVDNDASGSAGALYFVSAGNVDVVDTWFEGNDAATSGGNAGGGLRLAGAASLDVVRSTFCNNAADFGGGGYIRDVTGSLVVENNVFMDNDATSTGGAVRFFDDAPATIRNNHFLGNTAGLAGGVGLLNTDHVFVNNLVMGSTGDGVHSEGSSSAAVTYNLWFSNVDDHISGDVTSLAAGNNVVDVDPLLQGYTPGGACDDNVWPAIDSPLLDAGDPAQPDDLTLPGTIPSSADPSDIGAFGGANADPAPWVDDDGDHYPVMWDCDDGAAAVNPGATEVCDGQDNDCDGEADEAGAVGEGTYYDDTDGDSYGDPGDMVVGCEPGVGTWVTVDGDCDPTDGTVFPGATELCDGQLDDCDGVMLAGEVDTDGDEHVVCTLDVGGWDGAGTVTGGDDCDDDDDTVFPGATELCDGQLDDCDGVMLPGEVDADGDGYAVCTLDAGGWDGAGTVTGGDDCDDDEDTVYPGAPELCDGQLNDCDGTMLVGEVDADGDGYVVCELDAGGWDGDGTVVGGEDCDDDDPNSYPGNLEICDDLADNDCNGITDTDAVTSTWYLDGDGDGYGDPATATDDCAPPSEDHVLDNTDCDDTDAQVNVDAVEIPDNDVDEDCDGIVAVTDDAEIRDLGGRLLAGCGCATGSGSLPALPILLGLGGLVFVRRKRGPDPA